MTALAEGLTFELEPSEPLATLLPGVLDTIAGFAELDAAVQNRLRLGLSSSIDVVELTCAVQALGSSHNQ